MIDHVWLIADAETGDVSYVQHGQENDEANWKTIGPFTFSQKADAEAAADNPRFLPDGVHGEFGVMEVEASGFVQAIFNGFAPANTDVFALDDGLYPLTSAGAEWVDEALGTPVWGPLFDEDGQDNGLTWLDRVLEQVAGRIDMKMETVQAIGTLNAAAEDVSADIKQTALLVQQHVRIAITPEQGTVATGADDESHHLSSAAKFWLHTNGMNIFGLPELEIRNVPCWWVTAAGAELNGWAVYAIDQGIVDGDELDGGGPVPLKLQAVSSIDPFWEKDGRECLRLEVARVLFAHGHQKHGPEGRKSVH
jgi:hypothetical protein